MIQTTDNLRISSIRPITSPALIMEEIPLGEQGAHTVTESRAATESILKGQGDRLLVVTGPCSIHDTKAAMDYANRLLPLMQQYKNELSVIMRVYFEKPRTRVGWKGLINDPTLDNSFAINIGLRKARKLLVDLAEIGIPAGTEFLDCIIPQYLCDAIAWGAIGARTTESQVHRELASGLSMPVGFKNGTDGNINIAIDAICSARNQHHFLSISKLGVPVIVSTMGNDCTHVILRGSNKGPNYDAETIATVSRMLEDNQLACQLMVDCSHGNSGKNEKQQVNVANEVAQQVAAGSSSIAGVMLESHIHGGNQPLTDTDSLAYGVSITDACMPWQDTEKVFENLANAVIKRRA